MKKSLFLVALATMSLASCSNDEVMEVKQDLISFEAVADNGSRALDIYASANTPDMFKVYAVLTKGTEKSMYINGDIVKKTSEGYEFEGESRSWPAEGSLTFYAVVEPEEAGLVYDENEGEGYYHNDGASTSLLQYKKLSFDADFNASLWIAQNPFKPEYHHDLIYAVKAGQTKAANGKSPVVLNFRHAFSQVVLKAKNLKPTTSHVELGEVLFMNVKRQGDFTLPIVSTDAATTNKGEWSNLLPAYSKTPSASGNAYTWNFNGGEKVVVNSATAMDLMAASKSEFMAYPQTNVAYDKDDAESTGTFLRVYFDEYNIAGSSYNEATDAKVSEYPYVDVPLTINWEAGKKYTYTLIFGDGGIKFDLSVEDYIEDTDTPVYPN